MMIQTMRTVCYYGERKTSPQQDGRSAEITQERQGGQHATGSLQDGLHLLELTVPAEPPGCINDKCSVAKGEIFPSEMLSRRINGHKLNISK